MEHACKQQVPKFTINDEVFSTRMAFRGNTRDFGSFGEEMDKTTTLHQIHKEVVHTEYGDGVVIFKRQLQDVWSNGVRDLVTRLRRPFHL
ncbi:hypothetical protein Tco_1100147, partial [Tanacetum coccineum]